MGMASRIVEEYVRDKIDELMKHGAHELTGSLCRLIRMFRSQPVIGTVIVNFVMTQRMVPDEFHAPTETWYRAQHRDRLQAQKLCLGILAEDPAAEAEYEKVVAQYLQDNRALTSRLRARR
jgi:hypothetical protein